MRCLSPAETEEIVGPLGFKAYARHEWGRNALRLRTPFAERQFRIAVEQPERFFCVGNFIRTINRWLPPDQERLLWVDFWNTGLYGGHENSLAEWAWRGMGEKRSLLETPGILFDAQAWDQEDQTEIADPHAAALGMLVGLVTLMMMTYSDGWLISPKSIDRIEFWEGNFFFHSDNPSQLARANDIVEEYGCKRWDTSD